MWAHAEGAPELLTGEQLDTLEPRDLEYRCPCLPYCSQRLDFSVTSCLPALLTVIEVNTVSWGNLLQLGFISTWHRYSWRRPPMRRDDLQSPLSQACLCRITMLEEELGRMAPDLGVIEEWQRKDTAYGQRLTDLEAATAARNEVWLPD